MARLPISAQRRILNLEKRVFNLQQQLARMKEKHQREIAKLKAKKFVTPERVRHERIARRLAALLRNKQSGSHRLRT